MEGNPTFEEVARIRMFAALGIHCGVTRYRFVPAIHSSTLRNCATDLASRFTRVLGEMR
jgi:hypothetical protein